MYKASSKSTSCSYFVDRRFAVKARLSGILLIVVGLLKKFQEEQDKLVAILKLLQTLSTSSKNSLETPLRIVGLELFVQVSIQIALGNLGASVLL